MDDDVNRLHRVVYCGACGLYGTPVAEVIPGLEACGNCGAHDSLRAYQEIASEDCCPAQREADATLVEAAGCLCPALFASGIFRGAGGGERVSIPGHGEIDILKTIEVHDPACPQALGAAIRRGSDG